MKKILITGAAFCTGAAITAYVGTSDAIQVSFFTLFDIIIRPRKLTIVYNPQNKVFAATPKIERPKRHIPTREQQIKSLQTDSFDILIIGGGATGVGCALDSVTRGNNFLPDDQNT